MLRKFQKAVIRQRRIRPVETTTDLKQVIEQALSFIPEKERKEAVKILSEKLSGPSALM